MKVYTYSSARQRFAAVLDEAKKSGEVQIKRKDGSVFKLAPVVEISSPFSKIKGVSAPKITADEIVAIVREGRRSRV